MNVIYFLLLLKEIFPKYIFLFLFIFIYFITRESILSEYLYPLIWYLNYKLNLTVTQELPWLQSRDR